MQNVMNLLLVQQFGHKVSYGVHKIYADLLPFIGLSRIKEFAICYAKHLMKYHMRYAFT